MRYICFYFCEFIQSTLEFHKSENILDQFSKFDRARTISSFLLVGQSLVALVNGAQQRRTRVFDVTHRDQYDNLAAYRRGRGGRSSFSGMVVTVFGASGVLGKAIVNRLGEKITTARHITS